MESIKRGECCCSRAVPMQTHSPAGSVECKRVVDGNKEANNNNKLVSGAFSLTRPRDDDDAPRVVFAALSVKINVVSIDVVWTFDDGWSLVCESL